jgi:hypothetical protein
VSVSITGRWMQKHADDLQWLVALADSGYLAITWINHTFKHREDTTANASLDSNFLLKKGTDLDYEIVQTEALMVKNRLTPSVFFRFPGLVSDSALVHAVVGYGLITIGCDAWLGKDEKPKEGSIVLVHANGNEPYGIKKFFRLIKDKQPEIMDKRWLLLDLRESVLKDESLGTDTLP